MKDIVDQIINANNIVVVGAGRMGTLFSITLSTRMR